MDWARAPGLDGGMAATSTSGPRRPGAKSAIGKRLSGNVKDGLSNAYDSLRRGSARPELLLIPQDLRTADPSLFAELAAGTMGLAGASAHIDGHSPFKIAPPSPAWQAALLGFGWLSDLRAAQSSDAQMLARRTVEQWIAEDPPSKSVGWSTAIAARRLISWLTNANLLVDGAPPANYDRFLLSCDAHMAFLLERGPKCTGLPRLMSYLALVMGAICISDQEQRLAPSLKGLHDELAHQVLASGGHVSRNPSVLIELMLDLLPLKQCFIARDMEPPQSIRDALRRITPMLRHLQLGDRGIARFNGMSATEMDKLATVLSYDAGEPTYANSGTLSEQSRYLRLMRRETTVLMDGGLPPANSLSAEACAGALSFEASSGNSLLVVNAGAPGPADQDWRLQSRGTAAHSALVLNETASSRLVRDPKAQPQAPLLLLGPTVVEAKISEPGDGTIEIQGQHNGYQDRFGMIHSRTITLSAQGDRLSGIDRIFQPQRLVLSGFTDRSFAIHFHLHPKTRINRGEAPDTVTLQLINGQTWRFTANGAKLALEDSLFFANFAGPLRSVQIVLRGHARSDTQVRWAFERPPEPPRPSLPPLPQL